MNGHSDLDTRKHWWSRISFRTLLVLSVILGGLLLFILPEMGMIGVILRFWIVLLITFSLVWLIVGRVGSSKASEIRVEKPRLLLQEEQPESVQEVMEIGMAAEQNGVQIFRGKLRESAEVVYAKLKQTFHDGTVPLLQQDKKMGAAILLMPEPIEKAAMEKRVKPWINWLLLGLTIITTTFVGAAHEGVSLIQEPGRFVVGLPYSIGLLAILGVHELGHFFAAKRHGMNVTPPYFIPVPFALGTFGAFIKMKSPSENRRALFDVAVAGPLAGLVITIPALLIGLHSSEVIHRGSGVLGSPLTSASAGSSVLFAILAKLSVGTGLMEGDVLRLSPLAFAGWLGLLVTALNLLPIGQLDGGHIARAMFGDQVGRIISTIAMWTLALLAVFVWPSLMIWAIIVFFIAGRSTPPLNDITPLTRRRKGLGYVTFAILALILVPVPDGWWNAVGILF